MIDKNQVKIHFSKGANSYDEYAQVQKKMSDMLIHLLLENKSNNIKSILEIGCGTGHLTEKLIELFPHSNITAIDIAPGMITTIKSKIKNPYITFICGDIEDIEITEKYDLIISNATFQWFNDTENTLKKLYDILNSKGIICFSTFGDKTFNELATCFEKAKNILKINEIIPSSQSFYTLDNIYNLCKRNLKYKEDSLYVHENLEYEYFKNSREFLNSIKKIGATNSNKDRRCSSPSFIRKVMEIYDKLFKENGLIKATYHCVFVKINKP